MSIGKLRGPTHLEPVKVIHFNVSNNTFYTMANQAPTSNSSFRHAVIKVHIYYMFYILEVIYGEIFSVRRMSGNTSQGQHS